MRNPDLQKAQVRNPDLAVGTLNSLYPPSPVRNPQRALLVHYCRFRGAE